LDAADHIAEETHNAAKILPIAIGTSTILNGILGFAMLLALLFSMPDDIQATLASDTYYPFITIYAYATQSNQGGTALVSTPTIQPQNHRLSFLLTLFIRQLS
jgi:choline transport protein